MCRGPNIIWFRLAKAAAAADRLPDAQRKAVQVMEEVVAAVARWIGQITVFASGLPDPSWCGVGSRGGCETLRLAFRRAE